MTTKTFLLCVLGFFVFGILLSFLNHRRMKNLAHLRGEPNICQYARAFDFRNTNTKIMREVWNEIQKSLGKFDGRPFPIKAEDTFEKTYKIDPEDLDDIYFAVAENLAIDTSNPENNPYWNKVKSVKDLVLFLNHQPRKTNA